MSTDGASATTASPAASRPLSRLWDRFSFSLPASPATPAPSLSPASSIQSRDTDSGLSGLGHATSGPATPTPRSRDSSMLLHSSAALDADPASPSPPVAGGVSSLRFGTRRDGAEPVLTRKDVGGGITRSGSSWGKLKALPKWSSSDGRRTGNANPFVVPEGATDSTDVFEVLDGTDLDDSFPLDGEEGVVIDDEACFAEGPPGKLDFLSSLPHEISLYILLHLDFHSLLSAMGVSRQWNSLARDNLLWRDLFHREHTWRIREEPESTALGFGIASEVAPYLKRAASSSETLGSPPKRAAIDPPASTSRIGRKLGELMADLSGLSLTPLNGALPTLRIAGSAVASTSGAASTASLGSASTMRESSLDPTTSLMTSSTATPRRPASGIVVHPFPPSQSNLHTPSPLSRSPSSNALSSLESSVASIATPDTWRRASSATLSPQGPVPSPALGATPSAPLFLNWPKLYKDRYLLEQRWERGVPQTSMLGGHTDSVYCLQFDQYKVISGSRDRTMRVWDLRTMTCIKILTGHEGSILCLQYDDKILVSGSSDCRIKVWDLGEEGTGKGRWDVKMTLIGHNMGVLDLCFDDNWIVSCSKDTTIRVWHRATGELFRILSGHGQPVNAVQLLNNRVVSASGDRLVKMWDISTGDVVRVFTGHERGLACVQYSPSGKLIATGSLDKSVKIWDAETGQCLRTLTGHTDLVRSLAFDETRRRLVSASYDRTLRIWDLDTGDLLLRFKAHTSLVFDVTFSASKILSCSHDQKIMVLDFGVGLDVSKFM